MYNGPFNKNLLPHMKVFTCIYEFVAVTIILEIFIFMGRLRSSEKKYVTFWEIEYIRRDK